MMCTCKNENIDKKYELTNEVMEYDGHTLHRIKALKDFFNINKGDLGGWVESEDNLSQYGNCWVFNNSKVYGNVEIYDDARVINSIIHQINESFIKRYNIQIFDNASVINSIIQGTRIFIAKDSSVSSSIINGTRINLTNTSNIFNSQINVYGLNISDYCTVKDSKIAGHDIAISGQSIITMSEIITSINKKSEGNSINIRIDGSVYISNSNIIKDNLILFGNMIIDNKSYTESSDIKDDLLYQCQLLPGSNNTVVAYKVISKYATSLLDPTFKYDLEIGSVLDENKYNKQKDCGKELQFSCINMILEYLGNNNIDISNAIIVKVEISLDDIIKVDNAMISCKKATILDYYKL